MTLTAGPWHGGRRERESVKTEQTPANPPGPKQFFLVIRFPLPITGQPVPSDPTLAVGCESIDRILPAPAEVAAEPDAKLSVLKMIGSGDC